MFDALTDVPGLKVGHWTDRVAATGCTVVLSARGAVAGVDVQGAVPGTRETDLLNPICEVEHVHAIVLSGGGAYGLAAADGVMSWLEKRGVGRDTGVGKMPIVPAAALFDLGIGRSDVRPGATAGFMACEKAGGGKFEQGSIGAGTGAAVGKVLGFANATKGGLGTSSRLLNDEVIVAALVVVNAFGEVFDPGQQEVIAGARLAGGGFADPAAGIGRLSGRAAASLAGTNTTLAVIATNAALSKGQATQVSQMAQAGLARTIRPVHSSFDGDVVFTLSYGEYDASVGQIGEQAAEVLADAVVSAIWSAEAMAGLPSARTLMLQRRRSLVEASVIEQSSQFYEERDAA